MLVFEGYLEVGGSRTPLFSTSDRQFAYDMASVAERAAGGRGEVVMLLVNDGVIENDVPDWKHPDFPRSKLHIPFKEGS